MASLPYVPTWISSFGTRQSVVYILQPDNTNTGNLQLLALNTTQNFDTTSSLPLQTLSATLPFVKDGQKTAVSPAMDDQDNILVYAGDCTKGVEGSTLWQFKPTVGNLKDNGTWQEIQSSSSSDGRTSSEGANYLAAAIAFSSITNATADMYIFGGMCPNTTTSTVSDWTQNAEYSNNLLTFESSQSTLSPIPSYNLTLSSSRGAPIAEAGFTITPLAPTFSESAQNQTQSVNQNYVLIGGHTQQAFINMSQVALFSMPEQSWSFVSVDAPSNAPPTDLAARAVNAIDSRSGHTATLTPDGKKILVFGGWVGDVTTPADPQLAVLELGQGYGGNGDWQWAIPTASGNGLPSGAGIYGHGAAMIAGDVMLVTGGYQIPASGSNRRRQLPSSNTANYLFNTTSSSFISSYTRPSTKNGSTNDADTNATRSKERVGLGVGLTVGIIALILVVIIYFWYSRRLKRRRDARDEDLRNLAVGTHRLHLSGRDGSQTAHQPEMTQFNSAHESLHPPYQSYPWATGGSSVSSAQPVDRAGPEAARTGLLFEIPSPTRGLRRSLHSRGSYQPAPRYDDGRRGLTSTIHPIDERDEDENATHEANATDSDMIHRSDFQLLENVPVLDPFRDASRTPSPQSPEQRQAEVRGWMNDWTEAEAMMSSWNRGSPDKTDRTSSTLSDMSAKSMQSYSSLQRSTGAPSRTVSQKSAGLFTSLPNHPPNPQQDDPLARSPSSRHDRSRSLTSHPVGAFHHAPTNSDATDKSLTFTHPHPETDTLLGGNHPHPESTSPSRIGRRAKGWMGSMRRVFTSGNDPTPEHGATNTADSSPTKPGFPLDDNGGVYVPQRAASTGAMFSQRRQGARDWDPDVGGSRPTDEDWDVEGAIERRVVQVMFTVPKEKLRVVNGAAEGDGESVLSSSEIYEDAFEGGGESAEGKAKGKVSA